MVKSNFKNCTIRQPHPGNRMKNLRDFKVKSMAMLLSLPLRGNIARKQGTTDENKKPASQKTSRTWRLKRPNLPVTSVFPDRESQHDYQPSVSERKRCQWFPLATKLSGWPDRVFMPADTSDMLKSREHLNPPKINHYGN